MKRYYNSNTFEHLKRRTNYYVLRKYCLLNGFDYYEVCFIIKKPKGQNHTLNIIHLSQTIHVFVIYKFRLCSRYTCIL